MPPTNTQPTPVPGGPPTSGGSCKSVTLNFDKDDDENYLPPGAYIGDNEYTKYGLTMTASGGLGTLPRLFDTANPGGQDGFGDKDLGAPNRHCTPSGPGKGEGGEPDEVGANCNPLGNVLIVQEPNDHPEIPDDVRLRVLLVVVLEHLV